MIQLAQIQRFRMASVALRAPLFPEHPAAMTLLEIALLDRGALLVSELIRDLPVQCALIFLDCQEQVGPLGSGTPEGVEMAAPPTRWRLPGDRVSAKIEGIGSLSNPVMGANFLFVRFQPEKLFWETADHLAWVAWLVPHMCYHRKASGASKGHFKKLLISLIS